MIRAVEDTRVDLPVFSDVGSNDGLTMEYLKGLVRKLSEENKKLRHRNWSVPINVILNSEAGKTKTDRIVLNYYVELIPNNPKDEVFIKNLCDLAECKVLNCFVRRGCHGDISLELVAFAEVVEIKKEERK